MGEPRRPVADLRAADREALELPFAPQGELTAPGPERVDVIKFLAKIGERLPKLCERAFFGELAADDWMRLGEVLIVAGNLCQDQAEDGQQ